MVKRSQYVVLMVPGFRGLGAKGVGMNPLCHVSPVVGVMGGHPGAVWG